MKILLDTSVLIAAMVEAHPNHDRALMWLKRARQDDISAYIAAHTLAELYAVLTRLPVQPRISSATALQLIQENVVSVFEIIASDGDEYKTLLVHLAQQGITGGATYDALIAHTAYRIRVDHLITFNERDFKAVYPDISDQILVP